MEIQQTTNYSQFKKIRGNRSVRPRHVIALANSISESNMSPLNPIIVNQNMEVIDGQHRLEVARKNKLPVYFVKSDFATLDDVMLLNANLKPWKTDDYLESYCSRGFVDYIKLKDFVDRTTISISVAVELMSNAQASANKGSAMKDFKKGEFKATTQEFAEDIAQKLLEIKQFTEGAYWRGRDFIQALLVAYKYVTHEKFLEKLKDQQAQITPRGTRLGYIREFEDIANYKVHNPIRFY